jgi:hypothetical protein
MSHADSMATTLETRIAAARAANNWKEVIALQQQLDRILAA